MIHFNPGYLWCSRRSTTMYNPWNRRIHIVISNVPGGRCNSRSIGKNIWEANGDVSLTSRLYISILGRLVSRMNRHTLDLEHKTHLKKIQDSRTALESATCRKNGTRHALHGLFRTVAKTLQTGSGAGSIELQKNRTALITIFGREIRCSSTMISQRVRL
jgi:hypothetical protein